MAPPGGSSSGVAPWYRRKAVISSLLFVAVAVAVAVYVGVEYGGGSNKSSSPQTATESIGTKGLSSFSDPDQTKTKPVVTPITPSDKASESASDISAEDEEENNQEGLSQGLLDKVVPGGGKDYLGQNLWSAVTTQGGAGGQVCYPANGRELVTMASGPGCSVVVLTRGMANPYLIRQTIVISTPKVIIGSNPVDRATINGTTVERVFQGEWKRSSTPLLLYCHWQARCLIGP